MIRLDTADEIVTRLSFDSLAMSAVGTPSIIWTSPASSAATRAGALGIILKRTFSHAGFWP